MKDTLRKGFQVWYAKSVRKQLEEGTSLNEVKVYVALSGMKNHSTTWMIQSWDAFKRRPEITVNGLEKTGILPAINSVTD